MIYKVLLTLILGLSSSLSQAVSITPVKVNIKGALGTSTTLQYEVSNSEETFETSLVIVEDLKQPKEYDKVLSKFTIPQGSKRMIPVMFSINQDKKVHICAIKSSPSFYLRSCSVVQIQVQHN